MITYIIVFIIFILISICITNPLNTNYEMTNPHKMEISHKPKKMDKLNYIMLSSDDKTIFIDKLEMGFSRPTNIQQDRDLSKFEIFSLNDDSYDKLKSFHYFNTNNSKLNDYEFYKKFIKKLEINDNSY